MQKFCSVTNFSNLQNFAGCEILIRVTVGVLDLYPKTPTAVAKLLQYSGSKVKLKDGFSSCKMIYS